MGYTVPSRNRGFRVSLYSMKRMSGSFNIKRAMKKNLKFLTGSLTHVKKKHFKQHIIKTKPLVKEMFKLMLSKYKGLQVEAKNSIRRSIKQTVRSAKTCKKTRYTVSGSKMSRDLLLAALREIKSESQFQNNIVLDSIISDIKEMVLVKKKVDVRKKNKPQVIESRPQITFVGTPKPNAVSPEKNDVQLPVIKKDSSMTSKTTSPRSKLNISFFDAPETTMNKLLFSPKNPQKILSKINSGNVGLNKSLGKYLFIKGVDDKSDGELEMVVNKLYSILLEKAPDCKIIEDNKILDELKKMEPGFKEKQCILVMPKAAATNLSEIIHDSEKFPEFKKDLKNHLIKIGKIAFKDIITGNRDRFVRSRSDGENFDTKYLGWQSLNLDNIMFGTSFDKGSKTTAIGASICIDNFSFSNLRKPEKEKESTKYLVKHLDTVAEHICKGFEVFVSYGDEDRNIPPNPDASIESTFGISRKEFKEQLLIGLQTGLKEVKENVKLSDFQKIEEKPLSENTQKLIKLIKEKVMIIHNT
ncbi:hypothetical protein ACFLZV_00715 [Candidatus Margulisiibacteriota bacterium]